MKKLSLIAAMSTNRVIGLNNTLPWHLPADLRHFKDTTWGKAILMGRKTWESINRPLPGRTNMVLTRKADYDLPEGCVRVSSVEEALQKATDMGQELIIMGGATLYEQTLPLCDTLHLTQIDLTLDGDAFFPELDLQEWTEVSTLAHNADEKNPHNYRFVTLQRR